MTTDRALDILAMSEQARWREGIEPEDESKAVETIREALRSKLSVNVLNKIRAEIESIIGENKLDDYDFCDGLICARNIIDKNKAESEVNE